MYFLLAAFLFAVLEAFALWKKIRGLEFIAKPAVMIMLFIYLLTSIGLTGAPLWFGLGILFSLAGDVLLMLSLDRMFVFGLLAFLLAHISYLIGFQNELMEISPWSVLLIVMLSISAVRVMRRIVSAIRAKGQARMVNPVILYSTVITVVLYAAMTTISNPEWSTSASFLVSVGAFLFYISDLVLAWNKFVSPIKNGRIINIGLYHLGQIGLIAGGISQFG